MKDNLYSKYQKLVKDKDASVKNYIYNYLCKTQSMFLYSNLPDTIPSGELENILQTAGNAFITKIDNDLYALRGNTGGELDAYNRPTKYIVSNPSLKISKEYDINTDGILMKNDYHMIGLLPILGKYAVLLTDSMLSLNTASILSRITMLISASDDKTKQSADLFIEKINNGDFSIIGENAFFKGVHLQASPSSNSTYITQLIELVQYYKASLLNDIGLDANYNMKRERMNVQEVNTNIDALLPLIDNMLYERQQAIEKINEMYNTDISVDLHSAWKLEHETNDKILSIIDTETSFDKSFNHPTEVENEEDVKDDEKMKDIEETEKIEEKEEKEDTEEVKEIDERTEENEDHTDNIEDVKESTESEESETEDEEEDDNDKPKKR